MLTGVLGIVTLLWLPSLLATGAGISITLIAANVELWRPSLLAATPHATDLLAYGGHLVVFAIAAACACLIRNVIYAGIIATGICAWQVLSSLWFEYHGFSYGSFVAFSVFLGIAATLIAWYSASRDLGVDI